MPLNPGTFATSLSTVLAGQGQANQASAAYNAQVQQRQIEDQLKRAQLMMQLQDATDTRAAMKTLSPEDQRAMQLGEPYADIQKRQAVTGRVQNWKNMIGQALIDPDRPMDEKKKLLSIYGSIDENSDPSDVEKQLKDFAGLGEKPTQPNELGLWLQQHPGKGVDDYIAAKRAPKDETELKQVYDPTKGTTAWTYVPKTGTVGSTAGEVRPPMGANAIADADAASAGMTELQQDIKNLNLSPGQASMPNWWAVGRQKLGFGAGDPKLTDMLAQVSVINTTLTGMVMRSWGTRNVSAAQEVIRLHVPTPTDSPELINQKLDWWQRVGLRQYKTMLGATPRAADSASSAKPSGTPVYVGGKVVGYTTDGKTMTPAGP